MELAEALGSRIYLVCFAGLFCVQILYRSFYGRGFFYAHGIYISLQFLRYMQDLEYEKSRQMRQGG